MAEKACFTEYSTTGQCHTTELKLLHHQLFVLRLGSNGWGIYQSLYHKSNKEALALLCYVVKHLRRALRKQGGTRDTTEQSTVKDTLLATQRIVTIEHQQQINSIHLFRWHDNNGSNYHCKKQFAYYTKFSVFFRTATTKSTELAQKVKNQLAGLKTNIPWKILIKFTLTNWVKKDEEVVD